MSLNLGRPTNFFENSIWGDFLVLDEYNFWMEKRLFITAKFKGLENKNKKYLGRRCRHGY